MKLSIPFFAAAAVFASGCSMDKMRGAQSGPTMGFFVTSAKHKTGNLGGLAGADRICESLASAAGHGNKTWRAYLSAERDPANPSQPAHARSRIGTGPWYNANGVLVAKDPEELHARKGDPQIFIDERGQVVPGNWTGSPRPNEHDVLTGSTSEGTVIAGKTCSDWTSDSPDLQARVGHSDGIGRGGDTSGSASSWNSSHESGSCADTAPRGGAGRFYCFAQ